MKTGKVLFVLVGMGIVLSLATFSPLRVHAAVRNVTKVSAVKPHGIVNGTTFYGMSATYCASLVPGDIPSFFYAYLGTDYHLNLVEEGPILSTTTTFTDTSLNEPAIGCFQNRVYVAFTGQSSPHSLGIGYAVNRSSTLANRVTIPAQSSPSRPALAVHNNVLYAAWRSDQNVMTIEESGNGTSWVRRTVINHDRTFFGPSLAEYNGSLWVAFVGMDNGNEGHINFATYSDGNINLGNRQVASDYAASSLGFDVYNNALNFAFRGAGGGGVTQVYTGSWLPNLGYTRNGAFSGANTYVGVALQGGQCYFTGTDGHINQVTFS